MSTPFSWPLKALSLVVLSTALACAGAEKAPATSEPDFAAQGEFVSTRGYSAAFDATRGVGSRGNVSKRDDGSWAGMLAGELVTGTVTGERITGPNFDFTWSRTDQGLDGRGVVRGEMVRITVEDERLYIRNGQQNWSLWQTAEGVYQDSRSTITLKGQARELPMPQTLFSLLSFEEPGI